MKSKYDLDDRTPTSVVRKRLKEARLEGRIYVIANIVRVMRYRGYEKTMLSSHEQIALLKALRSVRSGQKVLANWLPLGYHTVRFISLARQLSGRRINVTKRDIRRIRQAARFYKKEGDWHSLRQLRSLIFCAKEIGITI